MKKCKDCGEYVYHWENNHSCTKFEIIDEDGEEYEVWADSEENAALKYAEEANVGNDYYLMNSEEAIKVNGNPYVIGAEPDVYYHAKKQDG